MTDNYFVPPGTKLDLGSGTQPAPGFCTVDSVPGLADYAVDFDTGLPWPFEDDSIEELRASHVIEHIGAAYTAEWKKLSRESEYPRGIGVKEFMDGGTQWIERGGWRWGRTYRRKDLLLHFFDEAFRVIKPGGKFEVRWPNVQHVNASGDPTHRRFISPRFIGYLSREGRKTAGVTQYVVDCNWVGNVHAVTHQQELIELGAEELGRRNEAEWNKCEETVMLLEAVK